MINSLGNSCGQPQWSLSIAQRQAATAPRVPILRAPASRADCDIALACEPRNPNHSADISGILGAISMSQPVVCIVHQLAQNQPGLINTSKFIESGCKVRVSQTTVPDLIMSKAGTTAAFLLVASASDLRPGSSSWERLDICFCSCIVARGC